jgi:hypothetical protein
MADILETIEVREHNGPWTRGPYPMEYPARAFQHGIHDICNPTYPIVEGPEVPFGEDVHPFAIVGHVKAPTRCEPEELEQIATDTMAKSTAYMVSRVLWHGTDAVDDFHEYLTHPDIPTVPREATHVGTIAAVLAKAYDNTPSIVPLLHLGYEVAVSMGIALRNIGVPYVIAPGYPGNAIAVTEDIAVNLTQIESTNLVQTDVNRRQIELTRFASLEFDYFKAVRAA